MKFQIGLQNVLHQIPFLEICIMSRDSVVEQRITPSYNNIKKRLRYNFFDVTFSRLS